MRSKLARRVLLVVPVGIGVVVATSLALNAGGARGAASSIEGCLAASGVAVKGVAIDEDAKVVTVNIASKEGGAPEDAMARMLIERELLFRKHSGVLDVTTFTVNMLDQSGKMVDSVSDMTLEDCSIVSADPIESTVVDEMKKYAAQGAEQHGLDLLSCEITQPAPGTNAVEMSLAVPTGDGRNTRINEAIGLLSSVCLQFTVKQAEPVQIYRVSIKETETGRALVDFVVDSARKSIRAWHAPDVPASWAFSAPPTRASGSAVK